MIELSPRRPREFPPGSRAGTFHLIASGEAEKRARERGVRRKRRRSAAAHFAVVFLLAAAIISIAASSSAAGSLIDDSFMVRPIPVFHPITVSVLGGASLVACGAAWFNSRRRS